VEPADIHKEEETVDTAATTLHTESLEELSGNVVAQNSLQSTE
jgi:hypothetical protein